ncbi:MAG: NTPase [Candidatus Scalindua sp.]|nr:NTPase [Candidatus Scalindua sp.]
MEFKVRPIEVPGDDPFKNDKLKRKSEIENLSNLVKNINPPTVLSINSPWGTGKTTFIKMWKSYLEKNNVASLYFNAWETDFAEDPLVAFLGEMNSLLGDFLNKQGQKNEAWEKTIKIGAHIAKKGIPALIKVLTSGLIDAEKIMEDEAAKLAEGLSKDAIGAYEDTKSSITEFKINLNKVVEDVCAESKKKPLIIFVDELDRCRPTYAIELLERIKHLFDIENIIFVLALDKEQLSHSVKSVYGSDFEATGYLRRFIDIEYSLKTPDIKSYIDFLFNTLGFESFFEERKVYREFQYERRNLLDTFNLLVNAYKLTLREVEHLLSRVNMVIKATEIDLYIYPNLLAFLIITREKNRAKYERYLNDLNEPKEMIAHFYSLFNKKQRILSHECALIEGFLINAKSGRYESNIGDALKIHEEIMKSDATDDEKKYSEKVIHVATSSLDGWGINLESLVDRIEMLEQFNFDNT